MRLQSIRTEDAWSDPESIFYTGDENTNHTHDKESDITTIFDKTELKLGRLTDRVAKLESMLKRLLKTMQSENHQSLQQ